MAPEILRYEKYDAKADLWSVGAVLYEMAVGKPPFRASNHVELLKKIEQSKGIPFPDEEPPRTDDPNANPITVVPSDIKALIRTLLNRHPVERSTFEDFFGSLALANSKFPRPERTKSSVPATTIDEGNGNGDTWTGKQNIPKSHLVIPPEVLDPTAMIPPPRINFRHDKRTEDDGKYGFVLLFIYIHNRSTYATCLRSYSSPHSQGAPAVSRQPSSQRSPKRSPTMRPLSPEGIPGETEEDGALRQEYVLVGDTRAIEFNQAVDGQ